MKAINSYNSTIVNVENCILTANRFFIQSLLIVLCMFFCTVARGQEVKAVPEIHKEALLKLREMKTFDLQKSAVAVEKKISPEKSGVVPFKVFPIVESSEDVHDADDCDAIAEDEDFEEYVDMALPTRAGTRATEEVASIPYYCGFEDEADNGYWTRANGTQTNKWYIGTVAKKNGDKGLYISNNASGNNNNYTYNATSYVYAYRKLNITTTGTYTVSFDWKANGQSNSDLLRAFLIPTSVNPNLTGGTANGQTGNTNNTPTNWIDVANPAGKLNLKTTWQTSSQNVNITTTGQYYLVFFWKNNNSQGSNNAAAVDNISVERYFAPTEVNWTSLYDAEYVVNYPFDCGEVLTIKKESNNSSLSSVVKFSTASGCPITVTLKTNSLISNSGNYDFIFFYNNYDDYSENNYIAYWYNSTTTGTSVTSTDGEIYVYFYNYFINGNFTISVTSPCKLPIFYNMTSGCCDGSSVPAVVNVCKGWDSNYVLETPVGCSNFQGWSTTEGGSVAYSGGQTIYSVQNPLTLYSVCSCLSPVITGLSDYNYTVGDVASAVTPPIRYQGGALPSGTTFSSNNTSVASVVNNTGLMTPHTTSEGSATIIVNIPATTISGVSYCATTVTYMVTVNSPTINMEPGIRRNILCGNTYYFYDSGGSSSDYSEDEFYIEEDATVFTSNGNIKINFSEFVTEEDENCGYYDFMKIYDGDYETGTLLAWGQTGCDAHRITLNHDYVATSGMMTIVWQSDDSDVAAGWAATITAYDCCTPRDGSFEYARSFVYANTGSPFTAPTLANTTGISTISYSSSNTSVATVDGSGHVVLAGNEGESTITATIEASNGKCASVASFIVSASASCDVIGSANTSGDHAPMYGQYYYSYIQMLYTASEIGGAGIIRTISFNSSKDCERVRNVKVYMWMTTKSNFTSYDDYISIPDGIAPVYSGGWRVSQGWNTLDIDDFMYNDPSKNIVVAVYSTAASQEIQSFYCTMANWMTIGAYSNTRDTNPLGDSFSWTSYGRGRFVYRPDIRFCMDKETVYSITYNTIANCGGATSVPTTYGLRGVPVNISNVVPTCSETFIGWATTVAGNVVYQPGDAITLTANRTLYAKYKDCSYLNDLTVVRTNDDSQGFHDGVADAYNESVLTFNSCLGSTLNLKAKVPELADGISVSSYSWNVNPHDGYPHVYSGSELSYPVSGAMGHDIVLSINTSDGCNAEKPFRVKVSKGLVPAGAADAGSICIGSAKTVYVGSGAVGEHSIDVPSEDVAVRASKGESTVTFIPDGPFCGDCFESTVVFSDFKAGSTIREADNIDYVRINLEHTFIGDLQISVVCPNGQQSIILEDYYTSPKGYDDYTYTWPHSSSSTVYLVGFGLKPTRYDNSAYCDRTKQLRGIGADYVWSNNIDPEDGYSYATGYVYSVENTILHDSIPYVVIPSDFANKTQFYHPKEDFSGLVGCPLNGEWKLKICDTWAEDNGYIFNWEIALKDIDETAWSYDVNLHDTHIGGCGGYDSSDPYNTENLVSEIENSSNFYIHPTLSNVAGIPVTIGVERDCELILVDSIGCESPGRGFTYTVVQPTSPSMAPTPICLGEEAHISAGLTSGSSGALTYRWTLNDVVIPEVTGSTFTVTPTDASNVYGVEVYDENGCGGVIDTVIKINVPNDVGSGGDYTYIWHGKTGTVTSTNWNTSSNWYFYDGVTSYTPEQENRRYSIATSLPSANDNVYVGTSTSECARTLTPSLSDVASAHNLTIGTGATVTVPSGKTLNIAGNLDNTGRLTATGGTVNFCGPASPASDQAITNTVTFGNVVFNNLGGNIVPSGSMSINGAATFTKGVVEGDVTFGNSASVANAETMTYNSFVDGVVTKAGSANGFTFPTGNNGVLGKVKASSNVSGVTVRYLNNPAGFGLDVYPRWWNVADMCSGNNPQLDHVSNFEYWDIGTSGPLSATLTVSSEDGVAHFNSLSPDHNGNDIYGAFWNGSCWENVGGVSHSVSSNPYGTISVGVTVPQTRSYAKIISLGSKSSNTVLPIELLSFTATCNGKYAELAWSTASEHNNDYFVLERSDDAMNFTEIARVAGAGNSIEKLDYSYNDYGVHGGDNYYRLVQVDYDGTRSVSDIVVAICEDAEVGEPDVQAYPNPFDDELIIELDNFNNRPARIEVFDMLGKLIVFENVNAPQNSYEIIMNLSNLPPTAYNIRVSTADFVINKQVIKN